MLVGRLAVKPLGWLPIKISLSAAASRLPTKEPGVTQYDARHDILGIHYRGVQWEGVQWMGVALYDKLVYNLI